MALRKLWLVAAIAVATQLLPGCTPIRLFKLSPITEDGTERIYQSGDECALVEDDLAKVTLKGAKVSASEMRFWISVLNKSGDRLDVLPDTIRVKTRLVDWTMRYLHVYSPDAYMSQVRSGQFMSSLMDGFAYDLSEPDPGKKKVTTTTSGTTSGYENGTNHRDHYVEHSTTVVDDPEAARAAEERRREHFNRQAERNQAENDRLEGMLLKATTLEKGERVDGMIVTEAADGDEYEVVLRFGKHPYHIRFTPGG